MGGRVTKFYPGAGRKGSTGVMCNFDVFYEADGATEGHAFSLDTYALGGASEAEKSVPGTWVLLQPRE